MPETHPGGHDGNKSWRNVPDAGQNGADWNKIKETVPKTLLDGLNGNKRADLVPRQFKARAKLDNLFPKRKLLKAVEKINGKKLYL